MEKVHPEIVSLIGRLKFRLSYSQNQLLHAVEVARLAGVLANELGLNVKQAMRGGLMHDIGKAMTHDHEGSHAVLGAEVARRCG
jgi:ribonuclease Y